MLLSLGLVLICGFGIGYLFEKIKIPKLIGMIIVGMLLGPSVLNIISQELIDISSYLRQIALVIILTRSGLSIDAASLKKIGLPAILLSFIPALFEISAILIFGPLLLKINIIESLLLGSVIAAVSPAIIVPRMIKLKNEKYGTDKGIPQLIMAGSSVDDVFVIVLFYAFLSLNQSSRVSAMVLWNIPISLTLGIVVGIALGYALSKLFKFNMTTTNKVLLLLSISLLFVGIEELLKPYVAFSSLISIMTTAIVILFFNKEQAKEIESGYKQL